MDEAQGELPLPFRELSADMPLLPARMVNEYQYCPASPTSSGSRANGPSPPIRSRAATATGGWTSRAAPFRKRSAKNRLDHPELT